MALTESQKAQPFRITSQGRVIERSLAQGRPDEWQHWFESGELAEGLGKPLEVAVPILRAACQGYVRSEMESEWLERILESAPSRLLSSPGVASWLSALADDLDALERCRAHGVALLAQPDHSVDIDGPLWIRAVVRRFYPSGSLLDQKVSDEQRASDLRKLTSWLEPASKETLGQALAQVWHLYGRLRPSPQTAAALDEMAQRLIDQGASAWVVPGRCGIGTAWSARMRLLATVHSPLPTSVAVGWGERLLANALPPPQHPAQSFHSLQETWARWQPGQEALAANYLRVVDPWQTKSKPGPRNGAMEAVCAATAWWDEGHTTDLAAHWLEALGEFAANSPATHEWGQAFGAALYRHADATLKNKDNAQEARRAGRSIGEALAASVKLIEASPRAHAASLPNIRAGLDALTRAGSAVIKEVWEAWRASDSGLERMLDLLMREPPNQQWVHPAYWWSGILALDDPTVLAELEKLNATPRRVDVTWTTLSDPSSCVDLPQAVSETDRSTAEKLLRKWGSPSNPAIAQMVWTKAVKNQRPCVAWLLEGGFVPTVREWDTLRPGPGVYLRPTPERGAMLMAWVELLHAQGWKLSGGVEGNVLQLLADAPAPPGLVEALVRKGATAEGLELPTHGRRPPELVALVERYRSLGRAEALEEALPLTRGVGRHRM